MIKPSKLYISKREKILTFMYKYQQSNKQAPSIRNIGEGAGISSTSVSNYYLGKMKAEGLIEHKQRVSRGTLLTEAGNNLARALLGIHPDTHCQHCGAPVNEQGKHEPKTKVKVIRRVKTGNQNYPYSGLPIQKTR